MTGNRGSAAISSHRILVAGADIDTRLCYVAFFASQRWEVIEAADGREALVKALTCKPSGLVTELRLPLIDGAALCGVLRKDREMAHVPIAVVTDDARASETQRALQAGADVVFAKSTPLDTLLVELRQLMTRRAESCADTAAQIISAKAQMVRCVELDERRHGFLSHVHQRMATTTPPAQPPRFMCMTCAAELVYQRSFVGGVSAHQPEQWDYYTCPNCGTFQYRQRTRRLRRFG